MPSFDAVLEPDAVELHNAVDHGNKEIGNRFDFKGSSARIELLAQGKERSLVLHADSEFQLGQVRDIMLAKLAKRGVDVRFLDLGAKVEKAGGDKLRQPVAIKVGVNAATAKRIQQLIKGAKLKLQAAYQGDAVRVTGAKRDELQAAIALLRREVADLPLGFGNFRD